VAGLGRFAWVLTCGGSGLVLWWARGWGWGGRVVAREGVDDLVVLLAPYGLVALARQRKPA
jgi:hypothetical protein